MSTSDYKYKKGYERVAQNYSNKTGFNMTESRKVVKDVLDSLEEEIIESQPGTKKDAATADKPAEGRLSFQGFGVFTRRWYKPRKGRNPSTGEAIEIPGQFRINFNESKTVGERLNPQRD